MSVATLRGSLQPENDGGANDQSSNFREAKDRPPKDEPYYFLALADVLPVGDGRHLGHNALQHELCRICGAPAFYGVSPPGFKQDADRRFHCGGHVGMVESQIIDATPNVQNPSE